MFENIKNVVVLILVILVIILNISNNSKSKKVEQLQQQINQLQLKDFQQSSELASNSSKNFEKNKQLNDQNYEKLQNNPLPPNTPCLNSDSLQELNNYIFTTSPSKP